MNCPQSGRLARLLEADLALHHAAPVALEWSPTTQDEGFVQLDTLPEDPAAGFNLFGYADRVDVVAVPDEQRVALEERGVLGDDDHDALSAARRRPLSQAPRGDT